MCREMICHFVYFFLLFNYLFVYLLIYSRNTGIVVYSGAKLTWVCHVEDGEVKSSHRLDYAGDQAFSFIKENAKEVNPYSFFRYRDYDTHLKQSCYTVQNLSAAKPKAQWHIT